MVTNAEKLVLAGLELAQDSGVAALRVDRVAELAGLNKRLIYHYYESRAGFCAALEREGLRRLHADPLLSVSSRQVLLALCGVNALDGPLAGGPDLRDLGMLVWPAMLKRYGQLGGQDWSFSDRQWVGFCSELMGIFYPAVQTATLGTEPRARLRALLLDRKRLGADVR
ncbi:MAG: TetR/AcrR family transcriptional regulator [Pseudomonadota bacterium]